MISSGYLEDLWNAHELREATRDSSCFASIDNNNNNNRRRKLKDNAHTSHRSLSSISASGSNEDNSDDIDAEALNLRQMAGTFLVHVVGSTIAIIVGLVSFWNKPRRRNNKKARQSQIECARQSQFESSQSTSSCNAAVDNNNSNNNKDTYTINQEHPYSVEGNNGCSTSSQLQQFEELTKRMDDFQSQMHTMLSLMASTKTKET
jgi:hypothetical protein